MVIVVVVIIVLRLGLGSSGLSGLYHCGMATGKGQHGGAGEKQC